MPLEGRGGIRSRERLCCMDILAACSGCNSMCKIFLLKLHGDIIMYIRTCTIIDFYMYVPCYYVHFLHVLFVIMTPTYILAFNCTFNNHIVQPVYELHTCTHTYMWQSRVENEHYSG